MAAKKTQSQSKLKPASQLAGSQRLAGKVAVITGGSKGIGYAVAQALAAEGCDVVISSRNETELKGSAARLSKDIAGKAEVVPITCDVRDPRSVDELFASVRKRYGRIDVLFNNAGISQPVIPLEKTSLEMWRDQIDTNLTGFFLCTRAALPLLQSGSTIINNLSAAAKQVFPNYYGYTAAKTGALGFTLSLRAEMIPRGIRVTALMPGATATDIWQQIMPNAPFDHMIKPENIAQAVLYAVLLPPEANLAELIVTPTQGAI